MNRISNYYYTLRYKLLKTYWDHCSRNSRVNGIALMYHHITDAHIHINDSCQHRIAEFRNTIVNLKSQGYSFVSIKDALNYIAHKSTTKFALVTFDDVPYNVYENAYPILKELNIPFALFITTSYLDDRNYLDREVLIVLDKDPLCTIGAHTITHPSLRHCKDSYSELLESKKVLENLLGHSIEYMAYPYGRQSSISHRIMKQAKRAGYKCAFGTIQSAISDKSSENLFYLPRIVIK